MFSIFSKIKSSFPNILTSSVFGLIAGLISSGLLYVSATRTLEIEYTKQIAEILPKIYSNDVTTKRAAIVALGSYGDNATPILITLLTDYDDNIKQAAIESLKANSNKPISLFEKIILKKHLDINERLTKIIQNKHLDVAVRSGALYGIGYLQADSAQQLANDIWMNDSAPSLLKRHAVLALAYLRDKKNEPFFLSIIQNPKYAESILLGDAIYGYSQVSNSNDFMNAVTPHLLSKNSTNRGYIHNELIKIPGERASEMLLMQNKKFPTSQPKRHLMTKAEIEDNNKRLESSYNNWLTNINYQKSLR